MKYKAITRREAERISRKTGYALSAADGRTFYLTNEAETEVWEYDSKAARDKAVRN